MKSRWGIVVALGAAAVALVLVMRGAGDNPAPDASRPAGTSVASDAHPQSPGERRPAAGGAASRRGDGAQAGGEEGSRPRQPSGQQGLQQRGATGGGMANARGGSGARIALPDAAPLPRAPELNEREALPPGAPGTRSEPQAFAEDGEAEEAPSDVAYDSGDNQVFDTGSKVEITDAGPINGAAGTISFWLEPEWEANSADGGSFVQLGDGSLAIVKDGDVLRFQYTDSSGAQHSGTADIADWKAGDWRNVIATWSGNMSALYVDGAQAFLNYAPQPPAFAGGTTLYVGATQLPNGPPVALGQLSYLTVLNRDSSVEEVRQMFESGGRPHQ